MADEIIQTTEPAVETLQETQEAQESQETPEQITEESHEEIASDSDKVSKHVPYERFKEVNENYKSLKAEIETLKQKANAPVVPQASPDEILDKMTGDAVMRARAALRLGQEDYLDLNDPRHNAAYNLAFQRVVGEMGEGQRKEATFNGFVNDLVDADPEISKIVEYVKSDWQNLPTRITNTIQQAFNDPSNSNLKRLERTILELKKDYHEKNKPKQKQTKEPPVTVTPKPVEQTKEKKVEEYDPTTFSTYSPDERAKMLGKLRRGEATWKSKG